MHLAEGFTGAENNRDVLGFKLAKQAISGFDLIAEVIQQAAIQVSEYQGFPCRSHLLGVVHE